LSHENKDREMLKSIDFPIELRPCYYTLPGTRKRRIMKNKKVLIRKDTGEPISIVSEGYYPLAHLKAIETGKEIYSHLLGGYPKNEIRILKLYHSPGGEVCNALLVPKNSELI
ncbi:MAG: hypothetical protein N3F09_08935, partial [Bacteroidia bacterium]|nr:hypothetical protein [Bacteroidia bacterium]